GDVYEQEADRVADAVMRMPEPRVQRQVEPVEEEEEEPVQTKVEHSQTQRHAKDEENARHMSVQRKGSVSSFPVDLITTGQGRALPEAVRAKMELALGEDFSDVRAHTIGQTKMLGGLAFTSGNDIYFAPGKYNPGSQSGQELLGHELAHVVQQRRHRVPTPKAPGSAAVVYDPVLEAEADAEGVKAARASEVTVTRQPKPDRSKVGGAAVQRQAMVQGAGLLAAARVWLASLNMEALANAASIATVVGGSVGTAAIVTGAVSRGKTGGQSVKFPEKVTTETDIAALAQIARFRIISDYLNRYLAAHPDALKEMEGGSAKGGGSGGAATEPAPTPSPAPTSAPTGRPEASAIDQQILGAASDKVKVDLAKELESNKKTKDYEFVWTESNRRDKPDIVGVSGILKLATLEGTAIHERLELTGQAKKAAKFLPDAGQTKLVKKFFGGRLYVKFKRSYVDDLAVSILAGVQTSVMKVFGGPSFLLTTEWYWSLAGPDKTTYLHLEIFLGPNGTPLAIPEYERDPSAWFG
ncbi:MAG: DUF4157 domain-containing protein, partial [Desulfobacteraceae bacterium]|nr:DUF4157 domain-containing protein [Desulfobacteraceae bacterium]